MAKIIDGKQISAFIKDRIKNEAEILCEKGVEIGLAVIIVGEDPASKIYVANKEKACEYVGFRSYRYSLPESTTNEELLELVNNLNNDDKVDGILCQLPLPKHLDEKLIIESINPEKDVDAFHTQNVGKIMIGDYAYLPCTPAGVMEMLKYENIDVDGKNCVVIGRSNIVGKPMAMLLLHSNATVTVCHSHTKNLAEICKNADVIVVAIGKAKFLTEDMVKEGAVIIDVGMDRDENGKLCGDVDYLNVEKKASYITPVPGGVGPMTISMLMQNTLTSAKRKLKNRG